MSTSASVGVLIACLMVFLACDGNQKNTVSEFELHPDFELSLVASEPTVFDPVDFVFDAKGDTYVLEMPGYPLSDEQSRLVRLTDRDGDGILEHRMIYAEELRQATSILPFSDGFLVAAPPELLYLKDTDGDGEADLRQVLMDGFPVGNLQHNFMVSITGYMQQMEGMMGVHIGRESLTQVMRFREVTLD